MVLNLENSQCGGLPYLCVKKWCLPIERVVGRLGFRRSSALFARERRKTRLLNDMYKQATEGKNVIMREDFVEKLFNGERMEVVITILSGSLGGSIVGYLTTRETAALSSA